MALNVLSIFPAVAARLRLRKAGFEIAFLQIFGSMRVRHEKTIVVSWLSAAIYERLIMSKS